MRVDIDADAIYFVSMLRAALPRYAVITGGRAISAII